MAPRYFFDTDAATDFEALLARFEPPALASPFRSTVPLLALVRDDWSTFRHVLALGQFPDDADLHFEFQVKSPRGVGRPSHADLMIRGESAAMAVEAKWTEPRYETVAARLARPESGDQDHREFAGGWLDLLRPFATRPLTLDEFSGAVYQMVHRAASVCAITRAPSLAYLHFTSSTATQGEGTSQYHADLSYLHGILGHPAGFPFHLVELPIEPTSEFATIKNLEKGSLDTDRAVRATLLSSRLFAFGQPRIRTIQRQA